MVGAGVIGLAVARALARRGRRVAVLEAERAPGMHTSSRNSEVIHAGFYYEPGSLKARLCVEGRRALLEYAAARGIQHRLVGKLVVAVDESEVATLESYRAKGRANGVGGLELLPASAVRSLEPEVRCAGALWSPGTGIIDSHGLLSALRADAEADGAIVCLDARVISGRARGSDVVLRVGGHSPYELRCEAAVNAGGLWAQELVHAVEGALPPPPSMYARGHYFLLAGRSPFRHLVYPVPPPGGLGIHVTLDLAGQTRFGPDVEWVDRVDYGFDESRAGAFEKAIRRYWPGLPDGALRPGYTGIRPKLGRLPADFAIERSAPTLVSLFGIESPGLTAALAVGEHVAALLS